MFKFTSIVFAIFACVGNSVSAGFLSGTPAVYSAGLVPSAYAAAPLTKYATSYTAGAPLTHTYAATSYAASPYFGASPWTGYSASSLGAYAAAPAHYTKYFAPASAYSSAYAAPVAAYRATYAAPAAYASYAAPAHAGFAHAGYAHSAYTQSAYNAVPFSAYAAAAPGNVAAW